MNNQLERRVVAAHDLRASKDGGTPKLAGYAAVFESYSLDMGFRERIAQGAFTQALARSDTRALFNHDPNYVLGRQQAGTLTLREDEQGLYMENTPPDTQWARDLMVSIERRDISQMSFGFTVKQDDWRKVDGEWVRTLLEIDQLFDVSPVTFPAYPDTQVALRSFAAATKQSDPARNPAHLVRVLRHAAR